MSVGLSLFCALANAPPQLHWSNFTFQPWTVNRRKCPKFDPYRDTIFHLYTKEDPQHSKVIIPHDDESLGKSGIDFSLVTIIFFHGFLESYLSDDAQSVKNAYLERGKYNVILVQNERLLAGPDYITAAKNVSPIGRYTAGFIDYLVSRGLRLKRLHVIGLSLGGHMAGLTGQFVKSGRLPRVTAFDPAGPLFNGKPKDERLDSSDAEFVDVIHTNSGVFGMKYGVGHLDFWPNGGTKQPGCKLDEVIKRYGFWFNWIDLISCMWNLFCILKYIPVGNAKVTSITNWVNAGTILCLTWVFMRAQRAEETIILTLDIPRYIMAKIINSDRRVQTSKQSYSDASKIWLGFGFLLAPV